MHGHGHDHPYIQKFKTSSILLRFFSNFGFFFLILTRFFSKEIRFSFWWPCNMLIVKQKNNPLSRNVIQIILGEADVFFSQENRWCMSTCQWQWIKDYQKKESFKSAYIDYYRNGGSKLVIMISHDDRCQVETRTIMCLMKCLSVDIDPIQNGHEFYKFYNLSHFH
jgi:hypothetical protein